MATSTTLVSLSKCMSQTCSANSVRDSTSPWRRSSRLSQAVDAGEHAIQDEKVIVDLDRHVQAVNAAVGHVDHIAFLAETLAKVLGHLDAVFDHQNFHAFDC